MKKLGGKNTYADKYLRKSLKKIGVKRANAKGDAGTRKVSVVRVPK